MSVVTITEANKAVEIVLAKQSRSVKTKKSKYTTAFTPIGKYVNENGNIAAVTNLRLHPMLEKAQCDCSRGIWRR